MTAAYAVTSPPPTHKGETPDGWLPDGAPGPSPGLPMNDYLNEWGEFDAGGVGVDRNEWGEFVFRIADQQAALEPDVALALARFIRSSTGSPRDDR